MGVAVEPPPNLQRPGMITLLAVLQFLPAAVWFLLAIWSAGEAGGTDGDAPVFLFLTGFAGVLSIVHLTCGIGLWRLKPYGRILQIVIASIGLLGFPVGTLLSIFILIYILKPGIRTLFSGRSAAELTPAELGEIRVATAGSQLVTVFVVILIALVAIAGIGIVAAVAVPGLLRARMAGNEAAAIGALRAINAAQSSYTASAGRGGYALSLAALAAPCPGASQGFIAPELSQDPSNRSGYVIRLGSAGAGGGPSDCNGRATEADYYATATPELHGTTGSRGFSTSSAGVIFFDVSGAAPTRSETLAGTAEVVQ